MFRTLALTLLAVGTIVLPSFALGQCNILEPMRNDEHTFQLGLFDGVLEARIVDSPSERAIKLLFHGAFDTEEFRGQYVEPGKLSVFNIRLNHGRSAPPSNFLLAAFSGENESVQWLAMIKTGGTDRVSIISALDSQPSCVEASTDQAPRLLSIPPGLATEVVDEVFDAPQVTYKKLGWR